MEDTTLSMGRLGRPARHDLRIHLWNGTAWQGRSALPGRCPSRVSVYFDGCSLSEGAAPRSSFGGGATVVQVNGSPVEISRSTDPGAPCVTASWAGLRYPMNSCFPAGIADGVKTNM